MESETEGVDSDNERVDNEFLPPEIKWYILSNPPNVNYSDKRATRRSMGQKNLIVVSNELHSGAKAYVKVVNDIDYFVKPTPPNNIIANETILIQCSIKQGIMIFGKKYDSAVLKELQ